VNGTEPPASLYPTLASGTLVPVSAVHYPYMPAVNFTVQGIVTQKFFLDRGPLFNVEDISGVMAERRSSAARTACGCRRWTWTEHHRGAAEHDAAGAVGTYLGWGVRKAGFSEGDSCDLNGGFIPFFRTMGERMAAAIRGRRCGRGIRRMRTMWPR